MELIKPFKCSTVLLIIIGTQAKVDSSVSICTNYVHLDCIRAPATTTVQSSRLSSVTYKKSVPHRSPCPSGSESSFQTITYLSNSFADYSTSIPSFSTRGDWSTIFFINLIRSPLLTLYNGCFHVVIRGFSLFLLILRLFWLAERYFPGNDECSSQLVNPQQGWLE